MTPLHASVFQVGDGPTDYWNIDLRKTVAKLLRGIPGHRMPLDGPCQKPGTATQKCHKRFAAPCRTLLSPSPALACSGSHAHRHHPLCVFQFPSHVVCIRFSQPDGCISDRRSSEPVRSQKDQGGELFHVGEGLANGMETTIEAGALVLRFCRPPEAALVVVALEFELSDEHQNPISNPARWPRSIPTTTPPTSPPIQPFVGRFLWALTIFLTIATFFVAGFLTLAWNSAHRFL